MEGRKEGRKEGRVEAKAGLRIAYSNQKSKFGYFKMWKKMRIKLIN